MVSASLGSRITTFSMSGGVAARGCLLSGRLATTCVAVATVSIVIVKNQLKLQLNANKVYFRHSSKCRPTTPPQPEQTFRPLSR